MDIVWKQNVLFHSWLSLNQVNASTVAKQKVQEVTGNGETEVF